MTAPHLVRTDHAPVLVVSGCEGATQRYRCWHALEQLQLRAVPARMVRQASPELHEAALGCGVVVLHRVAWEPGIAALIQGVRDAGGIALFDIDDLVFDPASTRHHHGLALLPPDERRLYHQGVRRYRRTLLACDGALAATDELAERIRALGRPAWVHRNVVDLEILRRSEDALAARRRAEAGGARADGRVVVGYASGSRTHDRDFAAAAAPALGRLMARRPEVVLRIVGPLELGPGWDALVAAGRVERVPAVDWRDLPAVLADLDISLAPLEIHNPFCRAKSELKWLEASACGVPSVAVATPAFAGAVQDGVTGFLAASEADWERALDALAGDPALRRRIGDAARRAVADRHATAAAAPRLEATLAAARAALRPDRAPPGVDEPTRRPARRRPALRPAAAACADAAESPGWRRAPGGPLEVAVAMPEPPRGSGGHVSILRMVAGLDAAGHRVTVHVVPGAQMRHATERDAARFLRDHFPRSGARIRLGTRFGPSDVAIATGWTTAHAVAMAEAVRTKLYFVQDFEPFFQPLGPDWLAAEATYRLGLGHVTLGPWLAETLRARYGARAEPIAFGVDHAIYHPGGPPAPVAGDPGAGPPARVVFYGRASTPRRGVALGLAALARVKAARPDVEVVLYGGEPDARLADFPHVQAGVLSPNALADLYRSAGCGLALSYTNLSFVPIEMAACGLPVVVARSEPSAWFQRDGETCLVAESTPDDLAAAILRVLGDPALAAGLAARARAEVAGLDWGRSTAEFVRLVEAYAAEDRAAARAGTAPRTGPPAQRPAEVALDALSAAPRAERVLAAATPRAPDAAGGGPTAAPAPAGGERAGEIGWWLEAPGPGLHRVDVVLRGGARPPDGLVVLSVRESPDAPEALAEATVRPGAVFDDAWTAFIFPPLALVPGGRAWIGLRWLPAPLRRAALPRTALAVAVDASGVPAHRGFALAPGAEDPAPFDSALLAAVAARRRDLAGLLRAEARLRGRPALRAAVAAWRAVTRPMPPVPLRPWSPDLPPAAKLLLGLVRYGPVAAAREVAAWRRWRADAPPGSDPA